MNAVSPFLTVASPCSPVWNSSVVTHPDAALLSLRVEFRLAVAETVEINLINDVTDEQMDTVAYRLNAICREIVDGPTAQTLVGRALKAAAAMHKLSAAFNAAFEGEWPGMGEEMAWHVLSEIAGDEYVPTLSGRWEPPRRQVSESQGSASR